MISSSEQAVGHGISILNKTFEDWTYTNNVGVGFNERANIWFVHGKKKDRESSNKSGLIIFDAATGEVLGIGLY